MCEPDAVRFGELLNRGCFCNNLSFVEQLTFANVCTVANVYLTCCAVFA